MCAMFYAHSILGSDKSLWQTLPDHSRDVSQLAATFGATLGIATATGRAGLLHDIGKFTAAFQRRIAGSGETAEHSIQGAWIAQEMAKTPSERIMADLIAYAIAGHHAGLPDAVNQEMPGASLTERLNRHAGQGLDPAWKAELAIGDQPAPGMPANFKWNSANKPAFAFQISVLGRMVFSCLVDADYKDTEAFYAGVEGRQIDRTWPDLQDRLPALIAAYDAHMTRKADLSTRIGRLRGEILAHVRGGAAMEPGLFTLTVPTGGGKTLASLGFALDHARMHGHRRIILAIPFTSIIDQTVDVFRAAFDGAAPDDVLLEHHSAIDDEAMSADKRERTAGKDKLKLAMEDWAAPIVVTTNVQLFESLFASRTSRARKLHNIAGSIIILDEAQTLPRHLLVPSVRMLDELAKNYGCTIVLCTATQPALDERNFAKGHPAGLTLEGRELAPDPKRLARELGRVTILRAKDKLSDETLAGALQETGQGLVIVNSRQHARALFQLCKDAGLDGLVHLTTRQYAAHRRRILGDVRTRLKDGKPCRVIATSLVEAGVDLDFPRVWRAASGLDQIAQAAGRCNREGRRPVADSIVTVFESADHKSPPEIVQLVADMTRMADGHDDLLSPDAMDAFFREVYWRKDKDLDREKILEDFHLGPLQRCVTSFAYRSVAEKYRMIESAMVPVIMALEDRAREAVDRLRIEAIPSGLIARQLQTFVVQVPAKERARLIDNGHVAFEQPALRGEQFAVLKTPSLYNQEIGLVWENADLLGSEVSIL